MNNALKQQEHNGKVYPLPPQLLQAINAKVISANPASKGYKRAKNLRNTRSVNYSTLKGLKNFFDYFNAQTQQEEYNLIGGDLMRNFVEATLNSERSQTSISKEVNNTSMPVSAMDNTLHLQGDVKMDINESEIENPVHRGAVAVILKEDGSALIVKRAPFRNSWMPGKFGLPGGKIDKGEEPIEAAKREIREEAGLVIEHFVDTFNVVTPPNKVDHVFVAKAPQNQEVKLNEEHTEFNWVGLNELDKYDGVPLLKECIELALDKLQKKTIYSK